MLRKKMRELWVPFSLNQRHVVMIYAEMKSVKRRLHKMNSYLRLNEGSGTERLIFYQIHLVMSTSI